MLILGSWRFPVLGEVSCSIRTLGWCWKHLRLFLRPTLSWYYNVNDGLIMQLSDLSSKIRGLELWGRKNKIDIHSDIHNLVDDILMPGLKQELWTGFQSDRWSGPKLMNYEIFHLNLPCAHFFVFFSVLSIHLLVKIHHFWYSIIQFSNEIRT